jgi:hypothetical protein
LGGRPRHPDEGRPEYGDGANGETPDSDDMLNGLGAQALEYGWCVEAAAALASSLELEMCGSGSRGALHVAGRGRSATSPERSLRGSSPPIT